jgi:hypothetical protein
MLLQEYLSKEYPKVEITLSGLLSALTCEQVYASFVSMIRSEIESQIKVGNFKLVIDLKDGTPFVVQLSEGE